LKGRWIVGIDIGGSFTDLVAVDVETGDIKLAKVLTTHDDLSKGVIEVFRKAGINVEDVMAIVHGTTIVINTIVERKGASVALITTKGFKDIIEIGRHNRPDMYNIHYKKPDPIVPRRYRFEVCERISTQGKVVKPLNTDEVVAIAEKLRDAGIEAVAVSLINSYANPEHERRVAEIVRKVLPRVYVSLSHKITREYKEYERTITTVLDAYVKPRVWSYIDTLQRIFGEKLLLLQAASGVISADDAKEAPIKLIESGPVAGVIGAAILGKTLGLENIITYDMGSTTTKSSLVMNGLPKFKTLYHVGGYTRGWPVLIPVVDISEVGVAGNSIVWIDELKSLRIGPRSAGSYPGPACYGLGGREPTVTDADLLVGRLDPDYFLGGELKLRPELALEAVGKIARELNMSPIAAAVGIVKLANTLMSYNVRSITVERGYDPRDFALMAFGGAGPLHASAIARELGIRKVVVPPLPAYFSAWGMLMADLRYDFVQTYVKPLASLSAEEVAGHYERMALEGIDRLKALGIKDYVVVQYMDLRYQGQEHTLTLEVPQLDFAEIRKRFDELHEKTYGFSLPSYDVECVNLRVSVIGITRKPTIPRLPKGSEEPPHEAFIGTRRVVYEELGEVEARIYVREKLLAGNRIDGPAVIEEATSTTVLYPGDTALIDEYGNIVIEVSQT